MGIKERREREKLQRQNDILDAAETVFFEKGYVAAKMDDVAEQAELSKGTLYLHFKNKEELYFGLTHRALVSLRQRFQAVLNEEATGLEKVVNIGYAYHQFSIEEPESFKTIAFYEKTQLEGSEEGLDVVEKCHMEGQGASKLVAAALQQGIDDGTVSKDIEPGRMAFLLQGMSNGILQLVAREGNHMEKFELFKPEDVIDDFIELIKRAIQPTDQ
jgi:TetR/AcrR family transcriptional regulator